MCFITVSWEEVEPGKKLEAFELTKIPTWVILDITSECNFKCSYCFNKNNGDYSKIQRLSEENFLEILSILIKQGIKQITLGGGEPLLHPNIVSFVDLITQAGITCHLISNGFCLDKQLAMKLKNAGLSQIQMNIDSLDARVHDRMRGRTGSFKKVINAFSNAIDAGLITVAQTVVTSENEKEVIEIFEFSRSIGIHRSRIWPEILTNMTPRNRDRLAALIKNIHNYAFEHSACSILSYGPILEGNSMLHKSIPCPPQQGMTYSIGSDKEAYLCSARKDLHSLSFERWRNKTPKEISKLLIDTVKEIQQGSYCGNIIQASPELSRKERNSFTQVC